jgi:hypothetical protein
MDSLRTMPEKPNPMIPQRYYFCASVAAVISLALIGQVSPAAGRKNGSDRVRIPSDVIQGGGLDAPPDELTATQRGRQVSRNSRGGITILDFVVLVSISIR